MSKPHFPAAKEWFSFKNATGESVDLFIYDVIGETWDGTGTTAKGLISQLAGWKGKKLNVRINSPGGSVFDGVAIYNALARHDGGVDTYVDGIAASIASIIALAGQTVTIAKNAMLMIHNPWTWTAGDANALRKEADVLDQIRETLLNTYETRSKKKRMEIATALDAETWLTADEAKEWGFVDTITEGSKARACIRPEVMAALNFSKAPESILAQTAPDTPAPETTPRNAPRSIQERKLALHEKTTHI